jgi:formylglycine-generating enzyme required for sulfatase activity
MLGNVWEWCRDGIRSYEASAVTDPVGPTSNGARRVLRGGSWIHEARDCRSACRGASDPVFRDYFTGFRCARVQA